MALTANYILVCDDVRREDNGKFLILGLYTPDVIVPQIPFVMPVLTFFANLESDRIGSFGFRLKIRHEESSTVIAEGMGMVTITLPRAMTIMPVKLGGIQLINHGLYSFSIEFENQDPLVTTFNVQLGIPGAPVPAQQPRLGGGM
jgi:hypothetical protein